MWDTPEDLSRFAAGTRALSSVLSAYGFTIRHERLPVCAPTNTGTRRWLLDLLIQLEEQQGPDNLLILHYRGGASLQRFDRPFRVSGTPIYFLVSETNCEFEGPGSIDFGVVLNGIRTIKAQTILLMDCDYAVGSWTGNDGCRVDVLAPSCDGSDFGDASVDAFNNFLVRELGEALEKKTWHSVPSLYAAMHKVALRPFATRAASGGSCISNVFRPLGPMDGECVFMTADEVPLEARVRVAKPDNIGPADEAQIVQRIGGMLETLASGNPAIVEPKHFVQVTGAGLVDGWLTLKMRRMFWHCLSAYRGWAEVDGDTVLEEGREMFSSRVSHQASWCSVLMTRTTSRT